MVGNEDELQLSLPFACLAKAPQRTGLKQMRHEHPTHKIWIFGVARVWCPCSILEVALGWLGRLCCLRPSPEQRGPRGPSCSVLSCDLMILSRVQSFHAAAPRLGSVKSRLQTPWSPTLVQTRKMFIPSALLFLDQGLIFHQAI